MYCSSGSLFRRRCSSSSSTCSAIVRTRSGSSPFRPNAARSSAGKAKSFVRSRAPRRADDRSAIRAGRPAAMSSKGAGSGRMADRVYRARLGITMTNMPTGRHRVLIVGGGFGGLYAAKELGRDERVEVTLVDRRNHFLFAPLLYQVATGAVSPGDIAQPLRSILRKQRNTTVLLGEAVGIDTERREVKLADGGPIGYDTLIVAT